ncbi:FIST C-terminal domain-containing protein [bacterium]|nr:FIST C-terminal domain-containing protein [bacterium]
MKVGIGYSSIQNFFESGKKATEQALENGSIDRPDFLLAFCCGCMDHHDFCNGIRSVTGRDVPVIGGSSLGIITNDKLSYDGFPSGVLAIQADELSYTIAAAGNLDRDEKKAGKVLAGQILPEPDDKLLLIFYDSVKKPPSDSTPPILNSSAPLIEGIEEKLKSRVPVLGAGLIGDYVFNPTYQFCGTYVSNQNVVGLMLRGAFEIYFRIMHGCTPLDGVYHTITRIERDIIYEVDGNSAVQMIDEIYGDREWRKQHPLQLLSIGVNYGEKYGIPRESNYVTRLITGAMPDGTGIGIFESDLENGTEFQFMLRDTGEMIESARRNSAELMTDIARKGHKPVLGIYIDCAGRTASNSNTATEEAAEIQKVFNETQTPLFGFFSGVEIAPFIGKSRGLDWTGVLIVLAQG